MRRPVKLPSYHDAFFGREAELERLHASLSRDGTRIVTILGPGGIGKTRLSVEYARQREEPIVFFDLSAASTSLDVCGAAALALDMPLDGTTSHDGLSSEIGTALESLGAALLVMDNAEGSVEPIADVVTEWLELAPELRVIVTSRVRLGLRAETTLVLGPLAFAAATKDGPAIGLFLDRAARSRSRVEPRTASEEALVREVVKSLEGWPLALELAAARLSVLSIGDLSTALADRFAVLRTSERDVSPRHRTLEETIRWSWDLLGPRERDLLAECTAFRDGFTLAAARAVVRGDANVLDTLETLRDSSLLRVDPPRDESEPVRYRVYESIRAFAAAHAAESGLAEGLRERHAEHYVAFCEARLGAAKNDQDRARVRLELLVELDNLHAAHEWAVTSARPRARGLGLGAALALAAVYGPHGPNESYLVAVERAVSRFGREDVENPTLLARALAARADARARHGRVREARADLDWATELARAAPDRALEATLALDLAVWAYRQGLLEESEQEALRAREIAATAGDQAIEAKVVDMLARIAVLRGDIDRALELSVLAVDLHRKLGDEAGALRALYTQGEIAMDRGQAARARELHELVVRGSRASDDTRLENAALLSLAVLDAADGRFDEADERFEHCIELTRKSGARNAESLALAYRAICHERAGRIEDARSDLIEAIELSRASGNRLVEGLALAWKGRLAADADEIDESEACLAAAGALLDAIGDDVRGMVVDLCRGHLELARARALDATDPGRAEMLRDAVGEQLARVSEGGQNVAWDVRAAAERLACAAEARGPLAPPSTEEPIVRVAVDGKWFWDSAGHPTDLTRHGALCRVLEALARQHRDAPGTPLSVDDVFSAGWPGQRAHPRSAASRVYTAISTLRRMGLKEVLIRHHDGYVLKRSAHIETVAKAE